MSKVVAIAEEIAPPCPETVMFGFFDPENPQPFHDRMSQVRAATVEAALAEQRYLADIDRQVELIRAGTHRAVPIDEAPAAPPKRSAFASLFGRGDPP